MTVCATGQIIILLFAGTTLGEVPQPGSELIYTKAELLTDACAGKIFVAFS